MIVYARKGDEQVPVLIDEVDAGLLDADLAIGSHGYAMLGPRQVLVHRLLLGLAPGDPLIGDHRNGNRLDNRRSNLRAVTAAESSANVSARGVSGVRGVYRMRDKWQARGKRNGRMVCLGTFTSIEAAAVVATQWRRDNLPGYVDR